MKILLCSHGDNGGNAYFTAEAINRYTSHEARAARKVQSYLDYPYDLLNPNKRQLMNLCKWADVIHARDARGFLPVDEWYKPCVMTYSGMGYRRGYNKLRELCKERRWYLTVSTLDLTMYDKAVTPAWLPNPRPDMTDMAQEKHSRFTVIQSPTFRKRKGTETVIQAINRMGDVNLVLIENTKYSDCLKARSKCHATIDQFTFGYGNSAMEAWAMGMPVISGISVTRFHQAYKQDRGYMYPFLCIPEKVPDIMDAVGRLKADDSFYAEMVDAGRDWFFTYHHSPVVAQKAIEAYEVAMDMFHKQNYAPAQKKSLEVPNVAVNKSLKVLSLGQWDYAGCGYFLSEAINNTTDHHSRAIRIEKTALGFPYDMFNPRVEEIETLWSWADVIHIHDDFKAISTAKLPRKPTVVTYHGTRYRKSYGKFNDLAKARGWLATVATPDLTVHGLPWLPDCRPDLSTYIKRQKIFCVSHAPTKRGVKGTDAVIEALRGTGIKLILSEKLPWVECLKNKGKAHLTIDQFRLGYGCSAIEAWAMGQAVVSGGSKQAMAAIQKMVGFIPFYECSQDVEDIREAILTLRDSEDVLRETAEFGIQCYNEHHSPQVTAETAIQYYAQALAMPLPTGVLPHLEIRRKKHSRKVDLIPTDGNVKLVEYVGRSTGEQTFWGASSGKKYSFSGDARRKYVFVEDVAGLLAIETKAGKSLFKEV